MAGESATTGPWALLGVTFVAAPPVRLLLGIERHRKHLTQIANGSHLFLIDTQTRDACRTSADVVERSILVYQGGSDALRQALLTF